VSLGFDPVPGHRGVRAAAEGPESCSTTWTLPVTAGYQMSGGYRRGWPSSVHAALPDARTGRGEGISREDGRFPGFSPVRPTRLHHLKDISRDRVAGVHSTAGHPNFYLGRGPPKTTPLTSSKRVAWCVAPHRASFAARLVQRAEGSRVAAHSSAVCRTESPVSFRRDGRRSLDRLALVVYSGTRDTGSHQVRLSGRSGQASRRSGEPGTELWGFFFSLALDDADQPPVVGAS